MILELSAQRLWKSLSAKDRLAAANHLFAEPAPEAVAGAFGIIARARRMRPQAVRAMAPEAQARAVASILDPGEALAASLLVALHRTRWEPRMVASSSAAILIIGLVLFVERVFL